MEDHDYTVIALAINHCFTQRNVWQQKVGISSCAHRIADALCKEHPEFNRMAFLAVAFGLAKGPEGEHTEMLKTPVPNAVSDPVTESVAEAETNAQREQLAEAYNDSHGGTGLDPVQKLYADPESPVEELIDISPVVTDVTPPV